MQDIWTMFNKMQSENVVYWNAILRGCDTHGHGKEFLKHFGQMFEENVISYLITVVCLLSTCMHASLVDEGMCYYVATLTWPSVGVKPNTWKSWGFGALRDS
jgi:hypothetical protein